MGFCGKKSLKQTKDRIMEMRGCLINRSKRSSLEVVRSAQSWMDSENRASYRKDLVLDRCEMRFKKKDNSHLILKSLA